MNKKKYISQLFDPADQNTIVTTDLAPEVSIDHRERLIQGIGSVLTMLGLNEMTPMGVGTVVKQYKMQRKTDPIPDQVGEGEIIPLIEYERVLVNTFELGLEKYRKQTTAEAIQKVGRNKAVDDSDTLLEREVQRNIKKKFFTSLNAGVGAVTNLGSSQGLQGALAAIWGQMSVYYEDMDVTPIYFVHPLDIASYLANAQITIQTAFGFQYIDNFLGLGTVVIDPSVRKGEVKGTVKENLNGVYIPSSGDVASTFGLTFDSTGLVGMKHFLADDRASVNTLLMTGATFYAEDASGIFSCDVEGTLGSLTVTSQAGTAIGDTKITITENKKDASNVYKYKVGTAAVDVILGQNVKNWTSWDGSADITAATGKIITVVEASADYKAVAVGSATVTAKS